MWVALELTAEVSADVLSSTPSPVSLILATTQRLAMSQETDHTSSTLVGRSGAGKLPLLLVSFFGQACLPPEASSPQGGGGRGPPRA